MSEKNKYRYEDNAELRTVTGWVCKTCGHFWGQDDHARRMASWCCCTDRPCNTEGCARRTRTKDDIYCDSCQTRIATERYFNRAKVDWDGRTPLVADDEDRYFFDLDELLDYMETDTPTQEQIEDLRLLICMPTIPLRFDLRDYLEDDLPEGQDPPGDWKSAEKAVNDYIEQHEPLAWIGSENRPTLKSILDAIERRNLQR